MYLCVIVLTLLGSDDVVLHNVFVDFLDLHLQSYNGFVMYNLCIQLDFRESNICMTSTDCVSVSAMYIYG